MYDQTRLGLGLDSINLNVQRTLKLSIRDENNVFLNENSVEVKPCINRESKSDEVTIQLYSCHNINMKILAVLTPPSIYQFVVCYGMYCDENDKACKGKFYLSR